MVVYEVFVVASTTGTGQVMCHQMMKVGSRYSSRPPEKTVKNSAAGATALDVGAVADMELGSGGLAIPICQGNTDWVGNDGQLFGR